MAYDMARNLPVRNFRFKIEIDGLSGDLSCTEISGSDATFDVIEYREGDWQGITPRKLSGLIKYGNITIKHGVTSDMTIYNWLSAFIDGSTTPDVHKITITALDYDMTTAVASWTLENAWPCKYTAPDFNATGSEVAIEQIEFAHEGVRRVS